MKVVRFITEENKEYFDFHTIKNILGYTRATTQRELKKIENKDIIKYKNCYLYSKQNLFELLEISILKKMMKLNG